MLIVGFIKGNIASRRSNGFEINYDYPQRTNLLMIRRAMRTIARFDAPEDAYLFRAFLGSRGISTSVLDENVAQWFWTHRLAVGGARVVLDDEAELAPALQAGVEYFAAINAKPSPVTEVRGWPVVLVLSWFFGGPLPIFGRRRVGREEAPQASTEISDC